MNVRTVVQTPGRFSWCFSLAISSEIVFANTVLYVAGGMAVAAAAGMSRQPRGSLVSFITGNSPAKETRWAAGVACANFTVEPAAGN